MVLFENKKGSDFPGMCAVFESSVPDLKKHPMNKCDPEWISLYFATYKSCASKIAIYPVIGEAYGGGGGGSW